MSRSLLLVVLAVLTAAATEEAEGQQFGRNKVQYRSFDFRVIKTEHFDVYFYEQERAAALDAARMAERSYARLARLLNHQFRERKPIILYASHSDFQQTNALADVLDESTGGVTEPIKNRIIMPFTGSYADFEHVLTHELVHAFQFDVLYRRPAAPDLNPFSFRMPLWFAEGMAEYLSLGRIDAHTASWLRDAVLGGYLRTIGEMSRRDDYLSYRFGQSLWAYIGSKWGDEAIGVLLQKAPRVGIERAFESTLGIPLAALSEEWLESVRSVYLAEVTERQRPAAFAKPLLTRRGMEDPWYLAPALSPDGNSLAFLSQRGGFFLDLWLADARTGRVQRKLIEAAREADFESLRYMSSSGSFSPDGRLFAFAAQTGGRDALYILDLVERRILARLHFELNGLSNPSWSPDGRRIVFTGLDGGISDLFVTDLSGRLTRLTDDRYADLLPAWSPDGRTIAFTTDRGAGTDLELLTWGNFRVALYDLEAGDVELLPHQDGGKNVNPVWSPDGESLVWVGDRDGVNNLYLFEFASRELYRVSDVLSGVIGITPLSPVLSWSRSGSLAFVHFERAGYAIYALDDPRTLPRTRVAAASPVVALPEDAPPEVPAAARPGSAETADAAAARPRGFQRSLYRAPSGMRESARLPERVSTGPVSVVALLDSATLALPDARSFEIVDYDVSFTPDIVGRPTIGAQAGGFDQGLYGGSFIALSDILGNHHILLAGQVNGTLSDAQFYAGYASLKRRLNWSAAFQQTPFYSFWGAGEFPLDVGDGEEIVRSYVWLRHVIRTVQGSVNYPFSPFRRVELGASATWYGQDLIYRGWRAERGFEPFRHSTDLGSAKFVQPSAALVFDNALFGWTGPISGRRYRLQVAQAAGDFRFSEAMIDVRNYLNYRRAIVLASRFVTLSRWGGQADQFALYWGHPYFIRGYDWDSFEENGAECAESRSYTPSPSTSPCPVRDQLIGSSASFANLELRFPIVTELQIGFLGSFPPVDAVLFFDGGVAWSDQICERQDLTRRSCDGGRDVSLVWDRRGADPYLVREPLFGYGIGLRLNVFYSVLRLDYAFPLNRPDGSGVFSLSFGPSF